MKEKRQCIEDVEESAQKTEDAETVEKFCSDVADDTSPDNCFMCSTPCWLCPYGAEATDSMGHDYYQCHIDNYAVSETKIRPRKKA